VGDKFVANVNHNRQGPRFIMKNPPGVPLISNEGSDYKALKGTLKGNYRIYSCEDLKASARRFDSKYYSPAVLGVPYCSVEVDGNS
jgi:hypothetical protein